MGCGLVLLIRACYSGAGSCLTYCLPAAKLKSPNLSNPFKNWQMKRQHIVENLCSKGSKARSARERARAAVGQRGPAASTRSCCLVREAGEGFAPAAMPSLGTGDVPGASAEGFNRGASSPRQQDLAGGRGCGAAPARTVLPAPGAALVRDGWWQGAWGGTRPTWAAAWLAVVSRAVTQERGLGSGLWPNLKLDNCVLR